MFHKGLALRGLGKHDEEITAYDKAIEISPHNFNAFFQKGFTLLILNKPDEALKAYDKAIEIEPHDSEAWNKKKILYLNRSNKSDDICLVQ